MPKIKRGRDRWQEARYFPSEDEKIKQRDPMERENE
jgi:hypothetical protein